MTVLRHVKPCRRSCRAGYSQAVTALQVSALFAPGYQPEVEAWALVDDQRQARFDKADQNRFLERTVTALAWPAHFNRPACSTRTFP